MRSYSRHKRFQSRRHFSANPCPVTSRTRLPTSTKRVLARHRRVLREFGAWHIGGSQIRVQAVRAARILHLVQIHLQCFGSARVLAIFAADESVFLSSQPAFAQPSCFQQRNRRIEELVGSATPGCTVPDQPANEPGRIPCAEAGSAARTKVARNKTTVKRMNAFIWVECTSVRCRNTTCGSRLAPLVRCDLRRRAGTC